jgi:uncharacterized membrane protein YbhN (UPF0104 family)
LTLTSIAISMWLVKLLAQLELSDHRIAWHWLGVALMIQCVYVFGYAFMWHRIGRVCGIGLPLSQSAAIWMFSIFGKYLPGRVLGLMTRMAHYDAHERGYGARAASACVLESTASIAAGIMVVALLAPLCIDAHAIEQYQQFLLLSVAATIVLGTPLAHRFVGWLLAKRFGSKGAGTVRLGNWISIVASYAVLWMLWGTVLVAATAAFHPEALRNPLDLVWIYQLAGISGILAVFAPSGFGVREGALLAGLLGYVPAPIAALITVVARLISLSAEALAILVGFVLLERRRRLDNSR